MAPPGSLGQGAAVDEAFGRVLRSLRSQARLSQEAVGLASGNGRTFVSQLERGERGASLKTLFRLAAALNVSASDVVRQVEAQLGTAPRGT
jgi:transcriptional regulator with XRE-family HTH domain